MPRGAEIMKNKTKIRSLKNFIVFITVIFFSALPCWAVTVTQIASFGTNPTNLNMYIYVPPNVKTHPPILVALHACHGNANGIVNDWASYGTQYGFIIIYPDNPKASDGCFDVHSTGTLTHNGGGDALGIVSMVKYAIKTYNADSTRVYSAGYSSGGMMTNVLLGSYPDVFKAGTAFAGVPFGCFGGQADNLGWCATCATGKVTHTAAEWGDLVRAAYPGYTGPRPKIQVWHGTLDVTLNYINFGEEIKQWTNVLGVSQTPTSTEANQPQSGFTRTRYANSAGVVQVEAISEAGKEHGNIVRPSNLAIAWLGLDKTTAIENGNGASITINGHNAEVKILRHDVSRSLSFMVSSFPGRIGLDIYKLSGKKIHTIAEQFNAKGPHEFSWDGRLGGREVCPAGVYVLSVKVNGMVAGSSCFTIGAN
jgi:poly(hydroxyalkanoate) depolymerase family esterase